MCPENSPHRRPLMISNSRSCQFHIGQSVMAKNLCPGPNWIPAVVEQRLGPLSYLVKTQNGQKWRRHVDHLKEIPSEQASDSPEESADTNENEWEMPCTQPVSEHTPDASLEAQDVSSPNVDTEPTSVSADELPNPSEIVDSSQDTNNRRYPARGHRPPDYYSQ